MRRYQVAMITVLLAALLTSCSKKADEPATERSQENVQETVQTETRKPVIEIMDETEAASEPETSAPTETSAPAETRADGTAGVGETGAVVSSEAAAETKPVKKVEAPKTYSVEAFEDTMYATASVNVRASYTTQSEVLTSLSVGQKVRVTGKSANGWMRIIYDGRDAYVYQKYLSGSAPGQKTEKSKTAPVTAPKAPESQPSSSSPAPGSLSDSPAMSPGEVPIVSPAPTNNTSWGGGMAPGTGSGMSAGPGSGSSQTNQGRTTSPVIVAGPGR